MTYTPTFFVFGNYSIEEARIIKEKVKENGLDTNYLCYRLHCDQCRVGGMKMVVVGNKTYEHSLRNTLNWYKNKFILGFVAMVAHDAHMSAPSFKTKDHVMMVFTLYPNKPIAEVLSCGDTTHIVSVVFNDSHYVVLYYDLINRTVTVYNGLNVSIKNWQDHIIHNVKTYGFQLPLAYSMCKY